MLKRKKKEIGLLLINLNRASVSRQTNFVNNSYQSLGSSVVQIRFHSQQSRFNARCRPDRDIVVIVMRDIGRLDDGS